MGSVPTPPEEVALTIVFDNLNRQTSNVKSYSIDSAYMTSTDAFSFTLYEQDLELVRNLELQPVSLYINGNLQLRGRIEITEVGGNQGLAVQCSGRDYICDMVECNVDPSMSINKDMRLEQVIKLAGHPVGIDNVRYDADVFRNQRVGAIVATSQKPGPFKTVKLKDYKANPGEGIYEFLARICVRQGATLQPTLERDTVLLAAPDYVQEPSYQIQRRINEPESSNNNVLNATAKRDFSHFPTVVLVTGKAAGGAGASRQPAATSTAKGTPNFWLHLLGAGTKDATDRQRNWATYASVLKAFKTDPKQQEFLDSIEQIEENQKNVKQVTTVSRDIQAKILQLLPTGVLAMVERFLPTNPSKQVALYRLIYLRDTLAKDTNQLANTTTRVCAEHMKDCLQYEVTVRGHRDPITDRTYTIDTVIDVSDEICNVYERLWIEHVRFSYSEGSGPITTLTCWRPDSFFIGEKA